MTPKQKSLYWRRWAPARKAFVELGGYTPEEADAERHALTEETLGYPRSSKDLTNRELDKVLDAFDRAAVLIAGPTASNRADDQPRKRAIWSIEHLGFPEPYIEKIARDRFGTSDWRKLPQLDLTRFCYQLSTRARSKAKTSPQP